MKIGDVKDAVFYITSRFIGYGPWYGEVTSRNRGSMVAMEKGVCTAYSILNLQQRGNLFISPMNEIYEGMIVGENSRGCDLACNPEKRKALTNHRASTKESTEGIDVPRELTLDFALEWIAIDELVEVTPGSLRMRKATLDAEQRKREQVRIS